MSNELSKYKLAAQDNMTRDLKSLLRSDEGKALTPTELESIMRSALWGNMAGPALDCAKVLLKRHPELHEYTANYVKEGGESERKQFAGLAQSIKEAKVEHSEHTSSRKTAATHSHTSKIGKSFER